MDMHFKNHQNHLNDCLDHFKIQTQYRTICLPVLLIYRVQSHNLDMLLESTSCSLLLLSRRFLQDLHYRLSAKTGIVRPPSCKYHSSIAPSI
jgi:hypothetical protein